MPASIDRVVRPLPSAGNKEQNMIDIIHPKPDALETWLVDSGGHIAVPNAGLALLETELWPGSSAPGEAADVLREG
jgi:hypothetical protein